MGIYIKEINIFLLNMTLFNVFLIELYIYLKIYL